MARKLSGVLPIVQTPFNTDDSIDAVALERSVDWAFRVGAQGVGTGMVSETPRLTDGERITVIRSMLAGAAGRGVPPGAAPGAPASPQRRGRRRRK